jgi:tRNA nucleotidyltransferase/poly(A) polymerase
VAVARTLESTGRPAHVTGECLADLLRGRSRRTFTLTTPAPPAEIAGLFAHAVPTAPGGAAWQVPTPAGPVDLLSHLRDESLEHALSRRGLTVWAVAWSPIRGEWIDPWDGRADLEAGRLRTVRPAADALAADPCLALHVARLRARDGDVPDGALEDALAQLGPNDLQRCAVAVRSRLLRAIVAGPHAAEAVALLDRTGLAAALGAGARPDTPALLATAPPDTALRLAVWLRGTRSSRFLRRHRIPPELAARVIALLAAHPVERSFSPHRRASLARLARLPEADREGLFWMRERELDLSPADESATRAGRQALRALSEALQAHLASEAKTRSTPPLAIDGRGVMEVLGIDPGPRVGEALAFLRARVAAAPERNEPEALRALLLDWARGAAPGSPTGSRGGSAG